MNYLNLQYLQKASIGAVDNNHDNFRKYIALKSSSSKNTDGWIIPNKLLPVNRSATANILIEANIIKRKKTVIKISKNKDLLEKDYNVSLQLAELNIPNYIKYLGFFSCLDNIDKNKALPKFFCSNKGENNYFLIMEYFPLGSLASYIPQTLDEVISIINQVIASSISAFEKNGFIHGDLHPGNILIKKTKKKKFDYPIKSIKTAGIKIILFDFDRSKFNGDFMTLFVELSTFINIYEKLLLDKNIFLIKNNKTPFSSIKKDFYSITNIAGLKNFVGNYK